MTFVIRTSPGQRAEDVCMVMAEMERSTRCLESFKVGNSDCCP